MRIIRRGSSGEAVRDVQRRLAALGFPAGDPPGAFGTGTHDAVVAFQRQRGLAADGMVGPDTWHALVDAGYRLGSRLLYHRRPMVRGDDVAELQRRLNALGFDAGKVDGYFGPDTLQALLEFQRNRHMAEDGICGGQVVRELDLMARATAKEGRDQVRERAWLRGLPPSLAGHRVMLDPFARSPQEADATWAAAVAAARHLHDRGAVPLYSRSEDTTPDDETRAARINRLGVDLVISFALPAVDDPGCYYFGSPRGHSDAGATLARSMADRLGLPCAARTYTMLQATRAPAVVVCASPLGAKVGDLAVEGVAAVFVAAALAKDQPPNNFT